MSARRIILASSSPFRRQLLSTLGLPFEVNSPDIDETRRPDESARQLVERLAIEKAEAITEHETSALVIGSDQVADHNGEIVGKPVDHDDAVRQLQQASGNRIRLYTGLALIDAESGRRHSCVEIFDVQFRQLDPATIIRYLEIEKPYNCCGSLRAEGLGISLLEKLSGDDPNTLIGLPLIALVSLFKKEGINIP